MVKLVNLRTELEEDVEFGTCELCMSTYDYVFSWYVFENEKGETHEIETGVWNYGDYDGDLDVDNVVDFAHYLDKQNIKNFEELDDNIYEYHSLYNEHLEYKKRLNK